MKQAQMKQANPLAVVLCGVALLSFAGTGLAAADAEQHAVLDVCPRDIEANGIWRHQR